MRSELGDDGAAILGAGFAGLALLADARSTREINIILKRVALAVWPRQEVAPLYGEEWAAFLDGSCGRSRFSSFGTIDDAAQLSEERRVLFVAVPRARQRLTLSRCLERSTRGRRSSKASLRS